MSKFDRNTWQKEYRKSNGNLCTKRYERTKKGKLVRTYRNMVSRVNGIVKGKAHLYGGIEILDKEVFYDWSLLDTDYNTLFDSWVESGYNKKLSPSIDRLNRNKGYTLDNIRWVTHSENSRLGGVNRWKYG